MLLESIVGCRDGQSVNQHGDMGCFKIAPGCFPSMVPRHLEFGSDPILSRTSKLSNPDIVQQSNVVCDVTVASSFDRIDILIGHKSNDINTSSWLNYL